MDAPVGLLPDDMLAAVDAVAKDSLCPQVREIDAGLYPRDVMKAMGAAGDYGTHVSGVGAPDLTGTIQAMSRAAEECESTAFCMWCQNALAWYVYSSDNIALRDAIGSQVATGEILGGTGLYAPPVAQPAPAPAPQAYAPPVA